MGYGFITTQTADFFNRVRELIELNGDILAVATHSWGPRHREYAIVSSVDELLDVFGVNVAKLSDLYVLCDKQLPVRGVADHALLEKAMAEITDGDEYVLLSLETSDYRSNQFFEGDQVRELEAIFANFEGQRVAFGIFAFDFDTRHADDVPVACGPLTEVRIGLKREGKDRIIVTSQFDGHEPGKRTKLGGEPEWIQADEIPICECCEERMRFIAQIDSLDADSNLGYWEQQFMFGDVGMIYVFYCFNCLETKSVFQCH